jgi:hypothetical protein
MDDFLRAEAEAPEGTRLALIDGEIVEWGANLNLRKCNHSATMAKLAHVLVDWVDRSPSVIGLVAGGEARCRLRVDPIVVVGLDMGFFEGERHVKSVRTAEFFDGPPQVAIDVLSGADTQNQIVERLRVFFDCGVPQVWIVDPDLRNVTVHRPSGDATLFTARQTLSAEPELPGFQVAVESLFPQPMAGKR